MNWRAIRAIIRKDLKVVSQSKAVVWPMIALPLILLVILPAIAGLFILNVDISDPSLSDFNTMLNQMPPTLLNEFGTQLSDQARLFLYIVVYAFAPMFLILPVMIANVIAADSFVGEKERKTLEALIYTPTSDRELYVAKLLSPWLAALAATIAGLVVYAIIINVIGWSVMERIFFPNLTWIALGLWVAPAAAGMGLGAMVLVSSRTSTFQEAYQLGGMVVLPIVAILYAQFAGIVTFDLTFALIIGLVLWIIDLVILWYGVRSFNRMGLLAQL